MTSLCGTDPSPPKIRRRRPQVALPYSSISSILWLSYSIHIGRDCAHLFFQNYERPSWAKVWEISAGSEPPFFAEHFSNWPEPVFTKFGARQDRGFIIPKSKQPPPPVSIQNFLCTFLLFHILYTNYPCCRNFGSGIMCPIFVHLLTRLVLLPALALKGITSALRYVYHIISFFM